jgi:cytochrome c
MQNHRSGPWSWSRTLASLIWCISLLATSIGAAPNQTFANDIERGRVLAEQFCSDCHAIGQHDESPTRVNENTSFRDLHKRFPIEMLLRAAKTGTVEGHDEMPAFVFVPRDMKALLKYIDALAPNGARKYLDGTSR